MENIILTNNKDLRLVGVKVGVLSTLRFELPLVSASATHVEVIVTSGNVHSAYTATFISDTKRWQCDIAASQFPAVGKQSYEIAYVLDGKQFWDGKGWIEIEDATTSGIEPQPRPEPYRYAVVSVNGYGADMQGAVRIPKTFISVNSPATTEGYMDGDIYFNRETGAMWTLCNVQGTLTWVFNYQNYYTKAETEEAIDRVAAYYITYDAAGNPFPTYAALANATTVYSGGAVRVPTRNDYCVVLADETHDNAEYRYIYAVADGETTGSWQPQFPVEGVMTIDSTVTKNSQNPVASSGIWSAIWGALSALPTGFASLYDWAVAQLGLKRDLTDMACTVDVAGIPQIGSGKFVVTSPSGTSTTLTPFESGNVRGWGWYMTYPYIFARAADSYDIIFGTGISDIIPLNMTVKTQTVTYNGNTWTVDAFTGETANTRLANMTDIPAASTSTPQMDGTGSSGTSEAYARGDHVHPSDTSKQNALTAQQLANIAAVPNKANDADVVHKTGDETIAGNKTFQDITAFRDEVLIGSGSLVVGTVGVDNTNFYAGGIRTYGHQAPIQYPAYNGLGNDFFALIQHIAPDYDGETSHTYAVNELRAYQGAVYRCVTAHTATSWVAANWALATVEDVLAALRTGKANRAANPTAGNLAALDASGNPTDSTIPAANVAVKGNIPYSLGTPTVIDTASSETVEGETVTYAEATLANRTANIVQVTAATALDELRITFPAATSGKVRDFGLRVEIGTGSAALAAPALVPVAPTGETIKIENNAAEIPALADGTATAKGVTLLYFSETAPGVFVVKGEQVEEVA